MKMLDKINRIINNIKIPEFHNSKSENNIVNPYKDYPIEMLIETMKNLRYEKMILEAKSKAISDIKNIDVLKNELDNIDKRLNVIYKEINEIDKELYIRLNELSKKGYKLYLYDVKSRSIVDYGIEKLSSYIMLDKHKRLLIVKKHSNEISLMLFRTPTIKIKDNIDVNFYHPQLFDLFYKDSLFTIVDMVIDIVKSFNLNEAFIDYINSEFGIDSTNNKEGKDVKNNVIEIVKEKNDKDKIKNRIIGNIDNIKFSDE